MQFTLCTAGKNLYSQKCLFHCPPGTIKFLYRTYFNQMQLKTAGESLNAFAEIQSLLKNNSIDALDQNKSLSDSFKRYSVDAIKAAIAQTTLNETQITSILTARGLDGKLLETTAAELSQIAATNGLSVSEAGASASTGGFSLALQGLAASMGTVQLAMAGAAAILTISYSIYSKHQQKLEEIRQAAEDAADTYKESSSSIDSYASRYAELREELIKADGNEEETYRIKKQLLDLQTELNDKFGDEYGRLNLVVDAYKDQTEAIKAYKKEAAQTFLNENEKGIRTASDKMTKEQHYNLSYTGMTDATDKGKALKEIAEKYEDQGVKILDEGADGSFFSVHLNADAQSAYDTINLFETDLRKKAAELGDEHMFDDVLEISSSGLNHAKKIIDQYSSIFRQSLIAEIAQNDEKAVTYDRALESVEKYNDAVLKSEDPYNDEKVAEARKNIEEIKNAVNENSEWNKYSSIMQDIFDQADTKLYDFNDKLQSNSHLSSLAKNLNGMSLPELQSLNPGENASFDQLKEAAGSYGVEIDDLTNALVRLGYVQDEIQSPQKILDEPAPALSVSETIDSINTQLKPALDSIKTIYQDIFTTDTNGTTLFTPENVDASALQSLNDTIKKLNETEGISIDSSAFENFATTLTNSGSDADDIHASISSLIGTILSGTGIIDSLDSSVTQLAASLLEQIGITNSEELIFQRLSTQAEALALAEQFAAEKGHDLSDAADNQVLSFLNHAGASETARLYLFQLIAAENVFNNSDLNTAQKIERLKELANAYGATAIAAKIENLENAEKNGHISIDYDKELKALQNQINQAANNVNVKFNPLTSTNEKKSSASNSSASKAVKEETDHMSALNSELEKYRSKLKAVQEARETYNQYGKITVDQAKNILDADFKLLAAYENEEAALENLGQAKLNEMQIQLARNAVDTINQITSEAQATEYLAGVNEHLAGSSLSATEAMLQHAVAAAKLRGTMQGQAADTILKGYQNGAMMLSQVDFGFQIPQSTGTADTKQKENVQKETEKTFSKEFNWIEKLINQLNKTTEKLKDSADRFISWWRKNKALDQAIKAARKEIAGNQDAYYYYIRKADKTGLNKKYKRLIQEGTIRIQDIKDEGLADKIEKYQDWWDKAQDCKDAVMELYDAEREMTNQKYDNMLEFYDSLDSKVQSVIDKIESLMGLKEARGKQLDINDLLEEFNSYDTVGQLQNTDMTPGNAKPDGSETIEVGNSGIETEGMHTKAADSSIQDAVTDGVKETAVYKGLLANIEKLEKKRAKKGKLSKKEEETLASYYSKKSALEENATADTAAQYSTTYDAYMKLQTKLDSGKSLTREQRMKYDQYKASLNQFSQQRQDQIDDLQNTLDNSSEKITDPAESYEKRKNEVKNSYEKQIADAESDVRNTKQYKEIKADIENLESKSKRTKSQEQKLQQRRLELEALESGGTSANISEYLKAFRRLTELSGKKKLSAKQQIEYDTLASQLRQWNKEKQDALGQLRSEMDDTIENLNTEQEKATNDSTAKIAENQKKAYETAKRIAEIGATTLESELNLLDSCMAGIEKRLTLYQKFGVDTLKKLGYIEGDMNASQSELIMQEFRNYLDSFNAKKEKLTSQRDIYRKLIDSVNAHDYSSIKEMYSNGIFAEYGDTFDKVIALLKDNTFDGYSQEWGKEWEQSFSAIEQEIDDLNMSTQDLLDTMREEVTFRSINEAVTQLGYLKDQLSSMSGLFQDDFLYAQNGALTDYGVKKAAVIIKQLENAQKLALEYREKYNRALSDDTFAGDKEKQDYLNNLKNQYSQELGEVKSFTEQLVSLYQNQKNSEINSLKEVIAKRKEALQAKKDYYNWDKNLKEKNKDIDALKAQIAATESINTAESKAKLASLRAELEDKETELNELKEDHLYSMQTEALDQFSNWLSEDTEARTKSLEYQREIVEQLSQITEGYDIADIIDSLEQYYLDQGYNALRDQTFTPSDINLQSGITESMIPDVHIPEFNYEGSMPAQANIDIHYDSMLKVEGNVDSYVVNDLKQHMETQYNYTKSRLTADLGKVGVMNR